MTYKHLFDLSLNKILLTHAPISPGSILSKTWWTTTRAVKYNLNLPHSYHYPFLEEE